MAEESYTGSVDADDTDELLYTGQELLSLDIEHIVWMLGGGANVLVTHRWGGQQKRVGPESSSAETRPL